jgi:hypothetical protein
MFHQEITPINITYSTISVGIEPITTTVYPCMMTPIKKPHILVCPGAPIKIKKIMNGGIYLTPRKLF